MESFFITLDNDYGHYEPGQIVRGQVIIKALKPIVVRKICVQFLGLAKTEWKLGETYLVGNSAIIDNVPYTSQLDYTHPEKGLRDEGKIEAGTTSLPFALTVPDEVPPSFENSLGCIRYWIKACIDTNMIKECRITTVPLEICANPNWKCSENLTLPIRKVSKKEMNTLFYKHRQIRATVAVNKAGFTVGESIEIKVEVDNESDKELSDIQLQLVQLSHFTAERDFTRPSLKRNHKPVEFKDDEIIVKEWEDVFNVEKQSYGVYQDVLRVPEVIPSFNNCQILQVNYILRVSY